jgi:DNA-binding NtrC family response regulator
MELLLRYAWPGNIRQLENAIERACVTSRGERILPENLPPEIVAPSQAKPRYPVDLSRPLTEQLPELIADFEKRYLRRALKKARGHIGRTAKITGFSRRSITDKIAQYKIDKSEFKHEQACVGTADTGSWRRWPRPRSVRGNPTTPGSGRLARVCRI